MSPAGLRKTEKHGDSLKSPKRTALVISGGGAKGAFAVGILRHLFFTYRRTGWFRIIGGTSTGALIAPIAALMGAPDPVPSEAMHTLEEMYTTLTTDDILEKQSIFELIQRQDALYESDPLRDLIYRRLRPEWFQWLQSDQAPDCYVVYTNYQTGGKIEASPKDPGMTRERFAESMLASASVPVVMEATIIDGAVCYDGGVRDLLPFAKAIKLGADTIVPIFLDPKEFGETRIRFRRLDKILLRTLAILVDETGKNDFAMASLINVAIRAKEQLLDAFSQDPSTLRKVKSIFNRKEFQALFGPEKRLVTMIDGLRPDEPLTEDSLTFDPTKMRRWLEAGEKKGAEIIQETPF